MGSSGTYVDPGTNSIDYILSDINSDCRVLKRVSRRTTGGEWRNAVYVAVQDSDGNVSACVVLYTRLPKPDQYSGCNLFWKYVDEDMGPYETDCPASVFNLLTPTDSVYANEWREKVRATLARSKPAGVRPHAVVQFARTLRFGDGVEEDTFVFIERSTFSRKSDGRRVRIPSWRTRYSYEVVAA